MRARFILLVFVALLMLRVNGSGQSAQLPPASGMKTVGLIGQAVMQQSNNKQQL